MFSNAFVGIEANRRNPRADPFVVDEHRQWFSNRFVPFCSCWRIESDIQYDYLTTAISRQQRSSLQAAKAESDVGNDTRGVLTSSRVESAWNIERGDACATPS